MSRPARSFAQPFERLEGRELFSAVPAALAAAVRLAPAASHHKLHAAAPALGGSGVSAQYFGDGGLANPTLTRTDPTISFAGTKGYAASLQKAASARWTGQIAAPTTGSYTFSAQSNGAVRLWVNGKQLLNTTGGSARSTTPIAMVAGQKVDFRMEYAKAPGAAPALKLFWAPAKGKQQVVPQSSLFPAAAPPSVAATSAGLIGQYYVGNNFQQLAMTRVDSSINFNFGNATPDASIPARSPYSIQWAGQFTPAKTDTYTFTATADDGVKLYVDGQLVLNNYDNHSAETVTGNIVLNAGQAYDLKVQYFNGTKAGVIKLAYGTAGGAQQPLAASVLTSTPPAAAGLLTVAAAKANEVDLTWTGSPAATGYTVSQSSDNGTTWQTAGTVPAGTTSFADVGLAVNTNYRFRVAPFGSSTTSTPSNVVAATTLLTGPAQLTAVAADPTDVDLSWSPVDGATGYAVLIGVNGSPFVPLTTTPGNVTAYHVAGLLPGTAYTFQVEALNSAGQPSDPTATAGSTATPTTAPAALLAAATSTTTATLNWTDTINEGGYAIERSATGTDGWTVIGTTAADVTTFTDANLTGGTTYYYRVRGLSAADASVTSDASNTAPAVTVTDAPADVSATAYSDTRVDLSWADVNGETGYTVLASVDGGATFAPIGVTAAGQTTFSVTPLLPATAYQFEVVATNANGVGSAPSTPAGATTPTLAPTVLTALSAAVDSAQLTWTPVVGVTGYGVERSDDNGATWAVVATPDANTITLSDTGLSAGVSYTYRVRGVDAGGPSAASPLAVALTLPAAPLADVAGVDAVTTAVSWPAVTGASNYVVQRSANGTDGWATMAVPNTTAATPAAGGLRRLLAKLSNPAASTLFYYRVIATNATGSSAPSAVVSAVTAPLAKYAAATRYYGSTADGKVYDLDMATGTSAMIGQLTPGVDNINRSPIDGKIYATEAGVANPKVYTWDPATGNNAPIGPLQIPAAVNRGAFAPDGTGWFTTVDGGLYKLTAAAQAAQAAPTRVGTLLFAGAGVTPITADGDMGFAPSGDMYITANSSVYTVSLTTATCTPLLVLPAGGSAFTFGQGGLMYATTPAGSQYTLNLANLVPTLLNNGAVPNFTTLTSIAQFSKLTPTVTPATTTFARGHVGTFQVQIANQGPQADAGPVTVTASLAAGLTLSGVTGTGWTATAAANANGTQTVTLTYANGVAAGASVPTAALSVNVAASAAAATTSTFNVVGANFQAQGAVNSTVCPVACV